jgi:hypothetical protein
MSNSTHRSPAGLDEAPPDYFVDMVEQLAERARALGEVEVAIHLDAAAKARQYALSQRWRETTA